MIQNIQLKSICLLLLLSGKSLCAQIYNYDPIRNSNFETTPSYLATDKYKYTAGIIQQGIPSASSKFYQETIKLSTYSQKYFVGLGLVGSHTHLNDSINYSYVGIAAAYRNVLFNKIHTKIGLMYKVINLTAPQGNFTYYSFNASSDGTAKQQTLENINASVSFSSATDKYFVSGGVLNYQVAQQSKGVSSYFPQYYFVNIGDFARIAKLEKFEISYMAFITKYAEQKNSPINQYLILLYNGFRLTRNSGIRYGGKVGVTNNTYLQYSPILTYYYGFNRRKSIVCNLLVDMGQNLTNNKTPFKSSIQLNLTYIFKS